MGRFESYPCSIHQLHQPAQGNKAILRHTDLKAGFLYTVNVRSLKKGRCVRPSKLPQARRRIVVETLRSDWPCVALGSLILFVSTGFDLTMLIHAQSAGDRKHLHLSMWYFGYTTYRVGVNG